MAHLLCEGSHRGSWCASIHLKILLRSRVASGFQMPVGPRSDIGRHNVPAMKVNLQKSDPAEKSILSALMQQSFSGPHRLPGDILIMRGKHCPVRTVSVQPHPGKPVCDRYQMLLADGAQIDIEVCDQGRLAQNLCTSPNKPFPASIYLDNSEEFSLQESGWMRNRTKGASA
jgi:hypothetical protein